MIRKARQADKQGVVDLITGCEIWRDDAQVRESIPLEFSDMFSNASFRPTFFVAEAAEEVVGCSCWNWSWTNFDVYVLTWMCVAPAFRRRGIGEALHRARLDDIEADRRPGRAGLVLLSTHLTDRYERFGFATFSEKPNLMMLRLPAKVV